MFIEQVMGRGVRNCHQYNVNENYDICFFLYPKYNLIKEITDTILSGYKHFLIEQLKVYQEFIERKRNNVITPTLFDNIEAAGKSITIQEVPLMKSWNELVLTIMPINPSLANRAMVEYAEKMKKDNHINNEIEIEPKYKEVQKIKSMIKSKIAILIHMGLYENYEYAHAHFNKKVGITNQSKVHNVDLLTLKLKHIQNAINNG
jgi:hypothetical protein